MSMRRLFCWRSAAAVLLLALLPGCATYQAYQSRFREPDYTVMPEFFTRSPRRVVIFPFAARSLKEQSLERAQVCRIAFYQHFSVRDFEDVDMQSLDRQLLPVETDRPRRRLQQFANTIRALDIVGLTSFLDWKSLMGREDRDTTTFRAWIRTAYEDLQADAYVLGITRGYGRIYAVAFSSIGLATHVEMRATEDDALLWSADSRARNMKLPLTIDPLDVPFLLFDIWKNSYGSAMDILAFEVYRDVVQTMPPLRAEGAVLVRADRPKTRVFAQPTVWALWPGPHVRKGTRLKFLQERRGWYQCEKKNGEQVWLLRRDGTLVGENGKPLERTEPLSCLWGAAK